MNRIQQISRDIEIRRLKLQMGIDPAADIDHAIVHRMWRQLNLESLKRRMSDEFLQGRAAPLPHDSK